MPLLNADGVELFYDLTGPDDPAAPLVVFSNSLGTSLEMWDAQVRALAGSARCLRYDTRGHGRSPAGERSVAIDDLADDLARLLDGLGVARAHVVGLSLGGMTAQAFAAAHPDRVDRLVLMATAAHLPPAELWDGRARTVRAQGTAAIVDGVMARWFTPAFHERPEAAAVRRQILATDPRGYSAACEAIRDMDLTARIGAIRAPTLVIAGADDPATPPAMSEAIVARVPGAEFAVVPGAHLLNIESAGIVNDHLLRFLGLAGTDATARGALPAGLANRKAVLGVDHVQRSMEGAGPFARPWQDFITRNAWGEIWGDPALPWPTRSLVTLAMMVALHREEEFKLHVRPALKNGVTLAQLRALLLQTGIYAGVPAANAAFRWVKEVLGDEADGVDG